MVQGGLAAGKKKLQITYLLT